MSIFKNLDKFKDKTCLIIDKEEISYKNLIKFSYKISKNISPRSLTLIICENTLEVIASYIACLQKSSVVILIDKSLSEHNLKKIIETYKPDYLFCRKNKIRENNYNLIEDYGNFHLLKSILNEKKYLNDNLSMLLTTSGTTGSSKLVRISTQNIFTNTSQIINSLKIDNTHRTITTMPMNYTYGLSIINTHLVTGSSIVLNNKTFLEKEFWKKINEQNVQNFNGVPFMYEILDKLKFENMIPKSIKYITQAGGKLS